MFKPVPMMRLSLVVLERDQRAVLRHLGQSDAVQLARTPAGSGNPYLAPRQRAVELARWVRLQARVKELRGSLEMAPSVNTPTEPAGMTVEQAEATIRAVEDTVRDLLKTRQQLLQEWARLTTDWEQVSAYRGWDIPLDRPDPDSFLHFITGTLPPGNLEQLQREIAENVALSVLPAQKARQQLVAVTTRQGRAALEEALQRAGFQRESLPAADGATTGSFCGKCEAERQHLSLALEQLNADLHAVANQYARPLAEIEKLADLERSLLEAEQNLPRTEAAILITGWVPAAEATALQDRVRQITGDRCAIETTSPDELPEEQAPVLLRHPRLLRPFQMLVTAYDLPKYQELEPTLFVAISYVLMFGMMFGDAGHGALLAAGGVLAFFAARSEKQRDISVLLLLAGLSSVIFGVLYGSCFGLATFKKYALWRDPLEGDPMALMYGAIGIGIVMISLGLVLNVINRFLRGDVIGGLLDKFGLLGILFYWGVLLLIAKFPALQSRGLVGPALLLFVLLPLAGWALKEPLEHLMHHRAGASGESGGLVAAMMESGVGAFEAVLSYLANTISFVRLAAYAMSHAALLVAAFMLAEAVKDFPAAGGVLSILVIILGNAVAILLEGIIASVQALRLEYYEFFGKFFSGGGQAFKPFRLVPEGRA